MHFRKPRRQPTKYKFRYCDKFLELVAKYRYLGTIFDKNLNFIECATTLAYSAGRALGKLFFNSDSCCGKIWNVFDLLNLHEIFENGEEVHLSDVKSKLHIIMQSMWCEKLSYKPKLRTYAHIKNAIETEPFLKGNISKFQRSLLTQLRIGILPLAFKIERYYRIPWENHTCKICKENFIEDEIHFVY